MLIQNISAQKLNFQGIKNNVNNHSKYNVQKPNKNKNTFLKLGSLIALTAVIAGFMAGKKNVLKDSIKALLSGIIAAVAGFLTKSAINDKEKNEAQPEIKVIIIPETVVNNDNIEPIEEVITEPETTEEIIPEPIEEEVIEEKEPIKEITTPKEEKTITAEEIIAEFKKDNIDTEEFFFDFPETEPDEIKEEELFEFNFDKQGKPRKQELLPKDDLEFLLSPEHKQNKVKSGNFDERIADLKEKDPEFELGEDIYVLKELKPEIIEQIGDLNFKNLLFAVQCDKKDKKYIVQLIKAINELSPEMIEALGGANISGIISAGKNSAEALRRTMALDKILDPEVVKIYKDNWSISSNISAWLRKTEDSTYKNDLRYLYSFYPCLKSELKNHGRIDKEYLNKVLEKKPSRK